MKSKLSPSIIDKPSAEQLEEIISRPHTDEELELTPELEKKIEKLINFFNETGINYEKFDKDVILSKKNAYPNYESYMYIPGQHNTQKWLEAIKNIYYKERDGLSRKDAIRNLTSGWNVMETYDFLNWLKYYESGEHMKYKFAQLWYENGAPGYFLHVKPDPVKNEKPSVSGKDIDFAKESVEIDNNKKQIIERQRNKIIGRLDSAEKLLRSPDGQIFAGPNFSALLEAIYNLKKEIQTVNKISSSTKLYEDMIVRQANILSKSGLDEAATFLYSVAQANNPPPPDMGTKNTTTINPSPPAMPTQPSGAPGGLPSTAPGGPSTPPDYVNENSAIGKFLNNLDSGKISDTDDHEADDLEIMDTLDVDDEVLLVTEAQVAPPAPTPKTTPTQEEPLEVSEEQSPTNSTDTNFGQKVDQVFSSVTINDVIAEFEFISNFFKSREIPRRLSRADMMLDSLELASFFPSLAEAQNKALESNNYISSRVDEILSKLRGSIKSNDTGLSVEPAKDVSPEVSGIKQKLQNDSDKEKARKQMRKDQENAELENKTKETPEVEINEDLAAPQTTPAAPPVAKQAPAV